MTDVQALALGFLQGFSEWLPISSTAHVAVGLRLFGLSDSAAFGSVFTAVSQLGSVLAALIYFRRDIAAVLAKPGFMGQAVEADQTDRRLLLPIAAGTLPVVICGLLFKDAIEGPLRGMNVIAGSMISFAIILAWVDWRSTKQRTLGSITLIDGIIIGIGQAFSLIPGASRSGTTITAALAAGFERATAARFSFLLSLPAITGAGLYELIRHWEAVMAAGMVRPIVIATVTAFVVGWASIDLLLKFLRRNSMTAFVLYRFVVGGVIIMLVMSGVIAP
ncbi:MAG: undecaprenyl-diphosphatase UppP [Chthonomonadales bacterium]|nr:undecaprenyl-diphosphatase UppP [Chthonomonadales bacterium]